LVMKKPTKVVLASLLSLAIIGASSASGAALQEGMKGSKGQLLLEVTTIAGTGEYGSNDGSAASVSFRSPSAVILLPDGKLLISDTENHLIRQYVNGEVSIYSGVELEWDERGVPVGALVDGDTNSSVFNMPSGIVVDALGNVYVADSENHAIRKIDTNGKVTTIAGDG